MLFKDYRIALSEAEQSLDKRLSALKEEFLRDFHGEFNPLKNSDLWQNGLYRFCHFLPKGADLHIHGLACLPVEEFIQWLMGQDDIFIFTGQMPKRGSLRTIAHGAAVPEGFKRFSDAFLDGDFSTEELRTIWTLLGENPHQTVWEWFETIFDRHMYATSDSIVRRYYEAVFRYYVRLGIQHVEIRVLTFGTPQEAASMASAIRDAYYAVMDSEPGFSVKLLGCGLKYSWVDLGVTTSMMENALYIHENVKDTRRGEDFLVGLDLVNEEDRSNNISFYGELLTRCVREHPSLKLMLHCGETLHTGSTSVPEALQLCPVRIGHGFNLFRHKHLEDVIKDNDICMEVCPVSNLELHYVNDLRKHPAIEYFRKGLPMVLASDDPAFQERENLTDDFFAAAAFWDLSLADLKLLAFNSIKYCSASLETKQSMFEEWLRRWDAFVLTSL